MHQRFASGGLFVGEGLPVLGKLLSHIPVQTTARYADLGNDPVKPAGNRTVMRISAVVGDCLQNRGAMGFGR